MKRIITIISLLLCGFTLAACGNDSEFDVPASFYYLKSDIVYNSEQGVIAAEMRESASHQDDLLSLLNLYVQGPISDSLNSPFPENTQIISASQDSNTLVVLMSKEYGQLSGLQLTLASGCLCKTALEYTHLETLRIECQDALMDGSEAITLTLNGLLLIDSSETSSKPSLP